ncbi:hypothetical protein J0H58_11430 [bacterium]|nr:hypothetical protein [bacterium]
MTCTEFRTLIADHLGNELLVEVREQFERHKVTCAHCTFFLESYTHTVRITRLLPRPALPPALEERLRAAVAKRLAEEPQETEAAGG